MFGKMKLYVLALSFVLSGVAQAGVVGVTSSAALGTNDSINWSQLGSSGTTLTGPQAVTSTGGLGATLSSAGGTLLRRDQGNGWNGNFANGTPIIWTNGVGPDITVSFDAPVMGVGAQIQADFFGSFTAEIMGIGGVVLGSFTENGNSNSNGDGSAIFIGLLSDSANITSIVFTNTAGSSPNDFAIGTLDLNRGMPGEVPEPASMALLVAGLAGIGSLRRKSRN